MEKIPASKKKKEILTKFNIHQSEFSTILKNKFLKASYTFGSKNKKCNHNPTRIDVDIALRQWFLAARAQSVPINQWQDIEGNS